MTINFVLCNASLELYTPNKKTRSIPRICSLLNEAENYRESDPNLSEPEDDIIPTNNKKKKRKEARPDILHFCLLALQDSILNKENMLQIWVQTLNDKNYKISPNFRIPRTWKVFNKVLANFLNSNSKRLLANDSDTVLMESVGPIESLIPQNSIRIAISQRGSRVHASDFISENINEQLDNCWFFLSVSPYRDLECPDTSGTINVAKLHRDLLARDKNTPTSADFSQALENSNFKINEEKDKLYDFVISIANCNLSAMATCYKIICCIERCLNY